MQTTFNRHLLAVTVALSLASGGISAQATPPAVKPDVLRSIKALHGLDD